MRNSLQVLYDWHIVDKSFFKSKTFKRHLNIYLDFAYVFCLFVSEGRRMICHRQIDFDLMIVNKSPKKKKIYLTQAYIHSLSKNTHTYAFYHNERNSGLPPLFTCPLYSS